MSDSTVDMRPIIAVAVVVIGILLAIRVTRPVTLGFVVVFALSMGVDHILHVTNVYPPYGEPMWDNALNALALAYRLPFNVFGSWVTGRIAPQHPMKHVWIGAAIGFVLSTLGAIAGIQMKMGPAWYPIALALSAWPCAWVGGTLATRGRGE